MLTGFFERTDALVFVVVGALALGSVWSWAVIIGKAIGVVRLRAGVAAVEAFARNPRGSSGDAKGLLALVLAARDGETLEEGEPSGLRTRREAAMRTAYGAALRRHEAGLPVLATLASAAPFVGLFGTVWGIMQSFSSIAASNDTSLAVVAPGIAGALFATAVGLGTAIPAVVAYNLFRAAFARCAQRLAAAVFHLAKGTPAPAVSR
jgi:biopolymer transport protein TolQ